MTARDDANGDDAKVRDHAPASRAEGLSREKTPMRSRHGRSAGRERATTSGITWLPAEQVPGAILSPQAQRELDEKLRALDEWVARSRASASTYWITR